MTLTKSIVAKLSIAFVAAAMVVSAYAPAAQAQTTEDLQQMINDLLAQVAALQAQTGQGGTSAAGVCPYTWTRDLSSGSQGEDVKMLQQFLNADPDTQVAVSGAGSAGSETMYYGPATAAAVSKLQVKYRSEILSPANLVNPTGYFGPGTRAKANSLCVAAPVMDDTDDEDATDDEDMDDDDDNGPVSLSGEAALKDLEIDSASDDELEEGAEDAEIAEVNVEFEDGDAEISRIDVRLVGSGDETDPWDVFETISLWVDGDKVAEENADDEDDYIGSDDTLRFSGLDIVGMEDEDFDITIAATLQNNLDGVADGEVWDVDVKALRFFDADGVASTDTSTGDIGTSVQFTIVEEGADDEVIVKTSSNDPDATTLQVEDDKKSDWYSVFVFDLDTDDSTNDIELNELVVTVTVSSSTYTAIVDDAELVVDGVTIDDFTLDSGADDASRQLTFDVDGDVTVDAGDRIEVELMLRFKSLALGNEGITVQGLVTATDRDAIDAEGADDVTSLSGAATGDAHTLRTAGIDVSPESVDADKTTGPNESAADDYGTYVIEVEVTAFEQDVYIPIAPVAGMYTLEDSAGSSSVAGTRSVTLTSTADDDGTYFEITEGETETLTLTVVYTPGVAGTVSRLVLNKIDFAPSATTPSQSQTTLPAKDYRTATLTMTN